MSGVYASGGLVERAKPLLELGDIVMSNTKSLFLRISVVALLAVILPASASAQSASKKLHIIGIGGYKTGVQKSNVKKMTDRMCKTKCNKYSTQFGARCVASVSENRVIASRTKVQLGCKLTFANQEAFEAGTPDRESWKPMVQL